MKKIELNIVRNRLKIGLDKLLIIADEVVKLFVELEIMKLLLVEVVKEFVVIMEQIFKDIVRRRFYNYNLLEFKEGFFKIIF